MPKLSGNDLGALIFLFFLGPPGWVLILLTLYSMWKAEKRRLTYLSESIQVPPSSSRDDH